MRLPEGGLFLGIHSGLDLARRSLIIALLADSMYSKLTRIPIVVDLSVGLSSHWRVFVPGSKVAASDRVTDDQLRSVVRSVGRFGRSADRLAPRRAF